MALFDGCEVGIVARASFLAVAAEADQVVIAALPGRAVDEGSAPRIEQLPLLPHIRPVPGLVPARRLPQRFEPLLTGRIAADVELVVRQALAERLELDPRRLVLGALEQLHDLRDGDRGDQADHHQHDQHLHQREAALRVSFDPHSLHPAKSPSAKMPSITPATSIATMPPSVTIAIGLARLTIRSMRARAASPMMVLAFSHVSASWPERSPTSISR